VNARAKINVPFGTSLTGVAKLPPGSTIDVSDRYAEKSSVLPKVLITLFFVWWIYSYLNEEGWIYSWTNGQHGQESAAQIQRDADAKTKAETAAAQAAVANATAKQTAPAVVTNAVPTK
jgi:hypothetical protein